MQALNILKVGAEAMLKDRMEKVKANGINVRFISGIGAPAEGIIDVDELKREREHVAGKLKLLGSVARKVSESAESSVLIVK